MKKFKIEPQEDGSLIVTLKPSVEHELIRWVLGESGQMEVLYPEELRRCRDEDLAAKFRSIHFVRIFNESETMAKRCGRNQQIGMKKLLKTTPSSNDTKGCFKAVSRLYSTWIGAVACIPFLSMSRPFTCLFVGVCSFQKTADILGGSHAVVFRQLGGDGAHGHALSVPRSDLSGVRR